MPSGIESREDLPVIELFRDKARRQILTYFLHDVGHDQWVTKGEINDNVDVSRESVRQKLDALVLYGVAEVKDPNANIPHYRLATTPVVEILLEWDGYPLAELLHFTGAQKLVRFFLTQAQSDQSYSYSAIQRKSDVGYQAASEHMDLLIEAGLVTEVDGVRSTEYMVDQSSDIYETLVELNEAVFTEYETR